MALQTGERYHYPDPECGCEIEVTKGAAPGEIGRWSDPVKRGRKARR
ncbi:MAG: hypothetical protein LC802_19035 [Acidobacteria bacterium]|nr:hypothetical protein [Acidobacteriota bacterium]